MEGSIAFGLRWSFLFRNSFITFLLHLAWIAFPSYQRLQREKESIPQWGSCSDVKQMRSENHGCYLPGCQLFPSLYLAQEANCPSATRVPLGLNVVRRTYFSGLRLTLWRNIPFQLRPMRWLLHIKGSFIGASSNNFMSPPLSAHLPVLSSPPLVSLAFHTHSQLNQCLGSVLSGESSALLQWPPSSSRAWSHRLEGNLESSHGELVWKLLFSFCLLLSGTNL